MRNWDFALAILGGGKDDFGNDDDDDDDDDDTDDVDDVADDADDADDINGDDKKEIHTILFAER